MTIRVNSELGRLRRVLVHCPGQEIDWMAPSTMERLLFDDILDSQTARGEHDTFRAVLQKAGVETLDPQDLLADVLEAAEVRETALETLGRDFGLPTHRRAELEAMAPPELAAVLVRGLRREAGPPVRHQRRFFDLDPVPNYFFQRDPQVVLGDRVVISAMATEAREREPFLADLAFAHHPKLSGWRDVLRIQAMTYWAAEHEFDFPYPHLEGGDVLVASPELVLIGLSARTNMQGIQALADYLRSQGAGFRRLLAVRLPPKRSYMHLDTVFTFIDDGVGLGFPPVVEPGGAESAMVYLVDLEAEQVAFAPRPSLQQALEECGVTLDIVPCGGSDPVTQHREQWTDGANAFALAPGVITLYQRNRSTAAELAQRGWRILDETQALADGVELIGQGPTAILLGDHELSRARGGPRCMTMPLERDDPAA